MRGKKKKNTGVLRFKHPRLEKGVGGPG